MSTPSGNTGPLGQQRGIGFAILIAIITLGIYSIYWVFKTQEEVKNHSGQGVGGVLGLVIYIVVGVVSWFLIPSEIGKMYKQDGREAPFSGWTGLWLLLPIIGAFVWFIKVQGSLNQYWESKASVTAPMNEPGVA
jgi:amino acid transporter